MKSVITLSTVLLIIYSSTVLAAPPAKKAIAPTPSEYLGVIIGHQSKQSILLSQRKTKASEVYVVSYKNEDAVFERAIPKSLYSQQMNEFKRIEAILLKRGSPLNASCSTAFEISRERGSHSFCRDLISKKERIALDQWFTANKNLTLGNLQDFQ